VSVIIQPDAQRISLELQNLEKGTHVTPTGTRVGCAANSTSVACRYKCRLYLNFRGSRIRQIFGYIGGSLFIPNSRQCPKVTFYIK